MMNFTQILTSLLGPCRRVSERCPSEFKGSALKGKEPLKRAFSKNKQLIKERKPLLPSIFMLSACNQQGPAFSQSYTVKVLAGSQRFLFDSA